MLERNRGARRDRTLKIKNKRIRIPLQRAIHRFEVLREVPVIYTEIRNKYKPYSYIKKYSHESYIPWGVFETLDDHDLGVIKSYLCKLDSRVGLSFDYISSRKCGDCSSICSKSRGCDWCYSKKLVSYKDSKKIDIQESLEYNSSLSHRNRVLGYKKTKRSL